MEIKFNLITEYLTFHAKNSPDKTVYIFLSKGIEVRRISFLELYNEAISLAVYLKEKNLTGERILLLYPSGIEFIRAFFACLYAGCIAVPAYPPTNIRFSSRIESMAKNCSPKLALSLGDYIDVINNSFNQLTSEIEVVASDAITNNVNNDLKNVIISPDDIAFLQYTSGSTSTPKGVMVSHKNIIANLSLIHARYGGSSNSVAVSWLPIYHDMGLIGGILSAVKSNCCSIFMPDTDFARAPYLWLEAVSKYKATVSPAPSFAFKLCVERKPRDNVIKNLDLSSWKFISSGAEPINPAIIAKFTEIYKEFGLCEDAIRGAYGMAESTLLISVTNYDKKNKTLNINKEHYLKYGKIIVDDESSFSFFSCGSAEGIEKLYIVNPENFCKIADGNVGEIWVKDPSVTKGYWNDEAKTREIFHAYEKTTGHGPFLRTGDLGFIYEGELYISGRLKDLIIINGQNIYPQDIEVLAEGLSKNIRPNSSACFSITHNEEEKPVLVLESNIREEEAALLFKQINDKIYYDYNFSLDDIVIIKKGTSCKTSSGKIQRQLTKKLYLENKLDKIFSAKEQLLHNLSNKDIYYISELQKELNILIKEILDLPQEFNVAIHDNFFHLGGNSFKANILLSRLYAKYKKRISMADFFKNSNIYHLEKFIAKDSFTDYQVITKTTLNKIPLSSNQQSLWLLYKALAANTSYNISYQISIKGEISLDYLHKAFLLLIERHDALRTNIIDISGSPLQIINSNFAFSLETSKLESIDQLDDLLESELHKIFILESDLLLRAKLFSIYDASHHYLLITTHHIISDGFSIGVLTNDLIEIYNLLYEGKEVKINKIDYSFADYICYKNDNLDSEYIKKAQNFWQKNQANTEYLKLPNAQNKSNMLSYNASHIDFKITKIMVEKIHNLCSETSCTLFDFLISAFAIAIHKHSAQNIFNIATPFANRDIHEFHNVIGYFADTILIKEDFSEKNNISFIDLMQWHREFKIEVNDKYNIPFAQILSSINNDSFIKENSAFQVMFVLQNSLPEFSSFKNTEINIKSHANKHAKTDLSLDIYTDYDGSLHARMEFASNILASDIALKICESFQIIINNLLTNPSQKIKDINYLSESDYNYLAAANFSYNKENDKFIDELISEQASKTPHNVAIIQDNIKITYAQLEERTNNLANYLIENGVKDNELVAVILDNSPELVISLIAIFKAGAAYLPIDINYPKKRIEYIIQDSNVKLILTKNNLKNSLNIVHNNIIYVDYRKNLSANNKKPEIKHSPDDLVYVIYTSGSTGKPKGVMNYKKGFANLLDWYVNSFDENLNILNFNSPAFDLAQKNLFAPLIRGNCLYLCNYDPIEIIDIIAKEKITWLNCAPSLLYPLIDLDYHKLSSLKMIFLGGEEINMKKINKLQNIRIFNSYGPTEASDVCSYCEITDLENITIGKPIPNVYLYILDNEQNILPYGVIGEIYIGGIGVGAGYINNEQLTSEKFIDDPFKPGGKLYKTGDLAKWQTDGNIKYIGRNDNQIKVSGIRIEPIEIENELLKINEITEAVIVKKRKNNNEILAAYLVVNQEISEEDIMFNLHGKIPNFMIPNLYYFLPKLPINANGKIDKKLLTELDFETPETIISPRDDVEQRLLLCWQKTLNITDININKSFFQLGGNSLLSLNLISEIYQNFKININISELFNFPTIELMAYLIKNNNSSNNENNYLVNFSNSDNQHGKESSVFILHGLGGNINSLYKLASGLHSKLIDQANIYGLEIPGYNEAEIIFNSGNDLIAKYVDIIIKKKQKNITLIGWSYGALITYNIVKKLSKLGIRVSHMVLIDADSNYEKFMDLYLQEDVNEFYNDDNIMKLIGKYDAFYQNSDDVKNDFFKILGYNTYSSLEQRDFLNKVALNNIKNIQDLKINEKITVENILIVRAKNSEFADEYCGWHNYITGDISSKVIAGDHWSVVYNPKLINMISSFISGSSEQKHNKAILKSKKN